jgi:hypothetical protein
MVTKKKTESVPFRYRLYNVALLVLKLAAKREEPLKQTRDYICKQLGLNSVELSKIENATPDYPFIMTERKRIKLRGLFKAELGLDFIQQHALQDEKTCLFEEVVDSSIQ